MKKVTDFMVIAKTPFRISFFGGGTDFPEYFLCRGGAVLSTSINKYSFVTVRNLLPIFEYDSELTYSKTEHISQIDEIKHPIIREAMKLYGIKGIRLVYDADLPSGSGMGTSSSFAIGILNAFSILNGKQLSRYELVHQAINLERVLCRESGGHQDQIAVAFGGLNKVVFSKDGFDVKPINMSNERKSQLLENLVLFSTKKYRISGTIQDAFVKSLSKKMKELDEIYKLVDIAESVLMSTTSDLNDFGRLLMESWEIKRHISYSVQNEWIENVYDKAICSGAIGGKLLGAGGGGFFLFYVEKDKRSKLIDDLSFLLPIPFTFEDEGAKIILNSSELLH